MIDDLKAELAAWDGKNTQPLLDLYGNSDPTDLWLGALIQLSSEPDCDRGATWLLKHYLESGASLPAHLTRAHLGNLAPLSHWEATLHVLQYLDKLRIPDAAKPALLTFVKSSLSSDARLVRAWAYYAFAVLACRFPEIKKEALAVFTDAEQAETAGSIKVRLRKARKLMTD